MQDYIAAGFNTETGKICLTVRTSRDVLHCPNSAHAKMGNEILISFSRSGVETQ